MKKTLALGMAAAMTATLLAGCGGSSSSAASSAAASTAETMNVEFVPHKKITVNSTESG